MPSVFAVAPLFGVVCTTVSLTTYEIVSPATRRFEDVDGTAGVVRHLDGGVLGRAQHVGGLFAVALLDQERAVLRDDEIRVGLRRAVEGVARKDQAVIVGVVARLHERERALGGEVAGPVLDGFQ